MDKYLKNAMRMLGESADKLFEAELPESMLDSYLVTALWSTIPYNSDKVDYEFLDEKYSVEDISKEYKEKAKKDCDEFLAKAKEIVKKIDPDFVLDEAQLGHDFWLTRSGQGAGFKDGDYPKEIDEALYDLTKTYKNDEDNLREALPEEVDEAYKTNVGRLAKMKEEDTKEDIAKTAVAIDEAKSSKVTIEFATDNDFFVEDKELAIVEVIRKIANRIEKGESSGKVMDGNGNSIGSFKV